MRYIKIITLLLLPFLGFSQIKLEPKTIFDGEMQISIPVGLSKIDNPISEVSAYEWLFANRDKDVLLSISYPSDQLNPNQLHAYKSFLIKGVKEDYPSMTITGSDILKINERQIGFIECHQTIDNKIVYTSIYFTSFKGKVFKISLEYTKDHEVQWKNVSKNIIGTLKIL